MTHDHARSYEQTVPKLAELGREVLFGDVWERPEMSARDRSLITVAALVAGYKTGQMAFHMGRALDNGVSVDELRELVVQLAFYTGWPNAVTAAGILGDVLAERPGGE